MCYTIKQFAKMFNVSEHTIRYYTDIGLLPCNRNGINRRVFDDESANWMQGIICLKGCGASIDDIKEYCRLCHLEDTEENLQARYQIILKQREQAYMRVDEALETAKYMDSKVKHYENVLAGLSPDDTNPMKWTADTKPNRHN